MSAPLRSDGWSVRPSFVPHGAVTPVTLLGRERAHPVGGRANGGVANAVERTVQYPIRALRARMALFATAAGVRYCWRNPSRNDFEALRAIVIAHGVSRTIAAPGLQRRARRVDRGPRRGIGSWLFRNSSVSSELTDARHVNLTLKDLRRAGIWRRHWKRRRSPISSRRREGRDVADQADEEEEAKRGVDRDLWRLREVLGVTPQRDRVYGAAGQLADYQVSSQIFASSSYGGIEAVSTSQYYHTTTMVQRDTAEMSRTNFGSCFVTSNIALVRALNNAKLPTTNEGVNYRP